MFNTLKQLSSNIPAALLGGGIFLFTQFGLPQLGIHLGFLLSFGVSIAGYLVGGLLIFPPKNPQLSFEQRQMLDNVLKEGERKLELLRTFPKKINNPEIHRKIGRICEVGAKIFEIVEENPENARSAQQFSLYYLDPTIKIIRKYIELSEHKAYSSEVQSSLKKVEAVLDRVKSAFEKQLSNLVKDDVLDLDTELSVFEEMIEIEEL